MNERIRIAVIGLNFGQYHVRTLANMPQARLVAVADNAPDAVDKLAAMHAQYGAKPYTDGIELLRAEKPDAVSLCVSPRWRQPLLEYAADNGIAVIIEKPFAADNGQAQRLAAICGRNRAPVMTAFSFRFHPAVTRLRELLAGDLGAPWLLAGEYVFDWWPQADWWLWAPDAGNGLFNENSCHLFDVVCTLLGEPASVSAEAATLGGSPGENAAGVTIRFKSGAIASLIIGGVATAAFGDYPRINLMAANGQARLLGAGHTWHTLTWALRGQPAFQTLTREPEALGRTRYTGAFEHFFECIRTGRAPDATVSDGMRSVALAMAVYESARTRSTVRL